MQKEIYKFYMRFFLMDIFSMFFLGLLGTGHCIGMCGPLVFAFPGSTGRFVSHFWYHAGRLGTYALVGALMGGAGAGLVHASGRFSSEPLTFVVWTQFVLSLFAAVFLLLLGLVRFGLLPEKEWISLALPEKIPCIGRFLRAVSVSPGGVSLLILGGMTGFIPCGLSYAAFARALPCGGCGHGALLLLAFGTGTLPGLLLLGTGFSGLFRRYRNTLELSAGLVMIAMAARILINALQAL